MKSLILSIVVPCYKVENYINKCLDSIFNQNVEESLYEVIVVNDGSPDNSATLVEPYTHSYSNCTLINQRNGGLSIARNTGLDAAKGQFVWFVDSDDWLADNALARVMDILESEPNVDAITTPLIWSYDDMSKNHTDIQIEHDRILSGIDYIKTFPTGAIQRNVIRREILEQAKIRFYPGILHEDGLFGPQMFYQAKRIYVVKDAFYNYRQRTEGSIMHSLNIKSAYDMVTVYRELMKYCETYVLDTDKLWWRNKYIVNFDTALRFTWSFRSTQAFKDFIKNTSDYRKCECRELLKYDLGLLAKIKIILIGWCPIACRIASRLYEKIKLKYNA